MTRPSRHCRQWRSTISRISPHRSPVQPGPGTTRQCQRGRRITGLDSVWPAVRSVPAMGPAKTRRVLRANPPIICAALQPIRLRSEHAVTT